MIALRWWRSFWGSGMVWFWIWMRATCMGNPTELYPYVVCTFLGVYISLGRKDKNDEMHM